eukprot:3637786-Amphidinium_carterae.1
MGCQHMFKPIVQVQGKSNAKARRVHSKKHKKLQTTVDRVKNVIPCRSFTTNPCIRVKNMIPCRSFTTNPRMGDQGVMPGLTVAGAAGNSATDSGCRVRFPGGVVARSRR